jgi:hypothetical protein
MVVDDNESTTRKNAGKSLVILIAMAMQRCNVGRIAHPGLHSKPLVAAIGQVPASYCPGGSHSRQI